MTAIREDRTEPASTIPWGHKGPANPRGYYITEDGRLGWWNIKPPTKDWGKKVTHFWDFDDGDNTTHCTANIIAEALAYGLQPRIANSILTFNDIAHNAGLREAARKYGYIVRDRPKDGKWQVTEAGSPHIGEDKDILTAWVKFIKMAEGL